MGLGKTIQVLGVLSMSRRNEQKGTDLIVVPASLVDNRRNFVAADRERGQKPFLMSLQPGHLEGAMVEIRSKFLERGIATFAGFQQGANALSKAISHHRFRAGLD